jgi:predicted PurR-regulated permease PerM
MQIPFYIKATFLLLLSALMVFCLIVTKDILMPVMLSLVVALVIYPLAIRLQKVGINWFFASLFSLSIILIMLAGIFVLIYFQIRNIYFEIPTIEGSVSDTINQIIYYLNQNYNLGIKYSDFSLEKIINQFSGSGLSLLNSTLTSIGDLVTFLLLIPIYVFLILLNKDNYKKFLVKIVDTESQNQLAKTIEDIKITASNYIIGLITVIIFVGILNSVGLMIIGIEHAIFWGFLASTLTIIPYIGIFIGSILPILYALLVNDSIIDAVYVLALFNFVQFLEGNFITPNIVGSKISINALTSILALIAGGMIWGISGMVLAMPSIAIMKAIFNNIESLKPVAQLMGEETATQNEDFYILLKHKLSKLFKKKNENSSQ